MELFKTTFVQAFGYVKALVKWLTLSLLVGVIGGVVGSVFHLSIDYVTELRTEIHWLVYLLPVGGLAIAGIYALFRSKGTLDTNRVLDAVRQEEKVPLVMAPLIFIGTVITHLFGGSAGREGAALQLGGSIGYNVGRAVRLRKHDIHMIVMAGMSAVFSALFGTPLTAAIFSLEVTNVGTMRYGAFLPCIASSIVAAHIAKVFGLSAVTFAGLSLSNVTLDSAAKVIFLAVLCALVSILFCFLIKQCEHLMGKCFKNRYLRSFVGGTIIIVLMLLVGTRDYNGAGMDVVAKAMAGEARPEAFFLKIIFTVITIAAGFKGGEIVPTFFIGATFGCTMGTLIGLDAGFAAAVGFVAVFCGVVNCPMASCILALEVFGSENILLFAVVCAISYMMSGYSGLYKSQTIVYSKLGEEQVDMPTK
ncbi:MAG: chloride channel protein [Clostridia bacterium]|nr:chloride channel protein [Clostridia bacterium]